MLKKVLILYLFSCSCAAFSAGCLKNTSWNQCREVKDIQICSSQYGGSETKAFRGVAKIQAPIMRLVPVLYDVEHYSDWQVNVKRIEIVKDLAPPGEKACFVERIEHSFGKKPWLMSWVFWVPDSDFVYKASYHLSPNATHFALYLENYDGRDVREEKKYRRGVVQSCYVLDSAENENETRIRFEIWVDLKLDVDPSIVNSNLENWPIDMINGLRNYVMEPGTDKDIKGLEAFLDQCIVENDLS